MAVSNYSVLLGTMAGYHRDQANNFGKFFHGHIDVQTPGLLYNTAIDVDSERAGVSVQWRILHLRPAEWASVFALSDGLHPLASNATSGAVDYYRDPRLQTWAVLPEYVDGPVPWWKKKIPDWLGSIRDRITNLGIAKTAAPKITALTAKVPKLAPVARLYAHRTVAIDLNPAWKTGTDVEALTDLESMLVDVKRVVIFGAAYPASNAKPPGLHDIHQNQGDPPGQFQALDAIWQDGLTIVIHSDGSAAAFENRFSTQSDRTDDQGHPLP